MESHGTNDASHTRTAGTSDTEFLSSSSGRRPIVLQKPLAAHPASATLLDEIVFKMMEKNVLDNRKTAEKRANKRKAKEPHERQYNEETVKALPTFKRWELLSPGVILSYKQKLFKKGAKNAEKELIKRMIENSVHCRAVDVARSIHCRAVEVARSLYHRAFAVECSSLLSRRRGRVLS